MGNKSRYDSLNCIVYVRRFSRLLAIIHRTIDNMNYLTVIYDTTHALKQLCVCMCVHTYVTDRTEMPRPFHAGNEHDFLSGRSVECNIMKLNFSNENSVSKFHQNCIQCGDVFNTRVECKM